MKRSVFLFMWQQKFMLVFWVVMIGIVSVLDLFAYPAFRWRLPHHVAAVTAFLLYLMMILRDAMDRIFPPDRYALQQTVPWVRLIPGWLFLIRLAYCDLFTTVLLAQVVGDTAYTYMGTGVLGYVTEPFWTSLLNKECGIDLDGFGEWLIEGLLPKRNCPSVSATPAEADSAAGGMAESTKGSEPK